MSTDLLFCLQGKWDVPLPKVRAVGEDEVFKVVKSGKTKREYCMEAWWW